MAYDGVLADRIRDLMTEHGEVVEKKMFGGLTLMLRGHMCCGVVGKDLMVRVGPGGYEEALKQRGAREMDFTGRPLQGFIYVDGKELESGETLGAWIQRGVGFVVTLPAK